MNQSSTASAASPAWTSQQLSKGQLCCRLCDSTAWMQFVHAEKGYHLLRCPSCEFISTDPIPTQEELARYYSEKYHSGGEGGIDFWEKPRRPVFAQVEECLRQAGKTTSARILDVGCAYGAFLRFLSEKQYTNLAGIDVSSSAIDILNRDTVFEGICADLPAAKLVADSRDVITFLDTLEHLPNFRDCIIEARRLLAPGGLVIVRVPNMNFHVTKAKFFQSMQWKPPYGMFTPPGHLNHFRPSCLQRLFNESGFPKVTFYNGVPDLVRSKKRVLFLQALYSTSNIVQTLSGGHLTGHSILAVAEL